MRILVSHVGYDAGEPKRAVLQADRAEPFSTAPLAFRLVDASTGARVFHGLARFVGPVPRWRDWVFWTLDFSELRRPGRFVAELGGGGGVLSKSQAGRSEAFEIGQGLLLSRTVPAVLGYFRSQRCSGALDEADRRAPFFGGRADRVDVHGGWYDASGDWSKYLSHLSYANHLNPQHAPLAVWAMLAAAGLLQGKSAAPRPELRQELLDEARYGAEFLQRMQDPAGYFYIGVFDRWTHEPAERRISTFRGQQGERGADYQAGYRQGGGLAIAALARAARDLAAGGSAGGSEDGFLRAAGRGFEPPGSAQPRVPGRRPREHHRRLLRAAGRRGAVRGRGPGDAPAGRAPARPPPGRAPVPGRICRDFWRADARGRRPFFHAADAGLPVVALLRYAEVEPSAERAAAARRAARRSLEFELAITGRTANPFGYARQYVQPVDGPRREAFFFPHRNESGYWWQGENARLASLAAAARLGRGALPGRGAPGRAPGGLRRRPARLDPRLQPLRRLFPARFRAQQPGVRAARYPNAYGGICNGVTGGFADEEDIDFLPSPYAESGTHRWRWSEQWLPHAAWYLLAACAASDRITE